MSTATSYDSSGVQIVLNHAPENADGRFWTFDADPEFVLGGEPDRDTSGAIWRVRGLARLTDGRIAVLSSGNSQVQLFSPSGALVKTIGRRGEGPGEFLRPKRMRYLPPDTLMVWDEWMGPVTSFDTTGSVLERRTIDLGRALERLPGAGSGAPIVPLPDGSFVAGINVGSPESEPPKAGDRVRHHSMRYMRLDEAYATADFGSWPGPDSYAVPEGLSGISPFARWFLSAWDNLFLIEVVNTYITAGGRPVSIYIGDGERNEIRQYALDGTLVRVIRRTIDPVPRSGRAHRAWQRNRIRYLMAVNEDASWVRPIVEAVPGEPYYPAFAGLTVDAEGYLWVREWSESETGWPDQWSVFSPEGRWLGVLRGPPNATGPAGSDLFLCGEIVPCWIGADYFLALRMDELGVERVEGYRLRRRR